MTEQEKYELIGNLLEMSSKAKTLPEETENPTFEKVRKRLNKTSSTPFKIPSFTNTVEKSLFNEARVLSRKFGFSMWLCQAILQDGECDSKYVQLMNYHLMKRYKK